jgi:acetolactate synthase-1/2/3 large subunit
MAEVDAFRKKYPQRREKESERPREIFNALQKIMGPDDYITTEVGQNQLWAAQILEHEKPRHFLTSGGLGTMGYGTGASLGVQVAHPEAKVANIAGDGCLRMNCIELGTAVRYGLPVVIVLMDNHVLGNVRQWQTLFFGGRYSETNLDPPVDWTMLAHAYGAEGIRIPVDADPYPLLKQAFDLRKPVIVDCEIPKDDMVYPMVPPGQPIDAMIGVSEAKG